MEQLLLLCRALSSPTSCRFIPALPTYRLQLKSKFGWSLSNLIALLRMNLFTHRNLWAWLDKHFDVLPEQYAQEKLQLSFK
jgi:hypothetical protein